MQTTPGITEDQILTINSGHEVNQALTDLLPEGYTALSGLDQEAEPCPIIHDAQGRLVTAGSIVPDLVASAARRAGIEPPTVGRDELGAYNRAQQINQGVSSLLPEDYAALDSVDHDGRMYVMVIDPRGWRVNPARSAHDAVARAEADQANPPRPIKLPGA